MNPRGIDVPSLKLTAIAPENQWLGDDSFPFWGAVRPNYQGENPLAVGFQDILRVWNFVLRLGDNKWCCKRPMKATKGCHGFQ